MREVIVYIAMSLDGYIADENGGVDWLLGDGSDPGNMGSYEDIMESVDTVILGYKTYHQIKTELSPDVWPYEGKKSYVLTHRDLEDTEDIAFVKADGGELIQRLKSEEGKDIWICGGASIVNSAICGGVVDLITVSVIPKIIGKGIKLFDTSVEGVELQLLSTKHYNGIVDLNYRVKSKVADI